MDINGADDIRLAVRAILQSKMPSALASIEVQKGLARGSIASTASRPGEPGLIPRSYYVNEEAEQEISDFPTVLILTEGVPRSVPIVAEYDIHDPNATPTKPDGDLFSRNYALLLHVYIMGQSMESLAVARDYLELAVWRSVMGNWGLGDNCQVLKDTYQMSYQDLLAARPGGMITGLSCRFQVRAFESIATPVSGRADTITTDVGLFDS